MKTLVVGNIHPTETQALRIWYDLSREIACDDVEFYKMPFEKTNFGQIIKIARAVLDEKEVNARLSTVEEDYRELMQVVIEYYKKNILSRGRYQQIVEVFLWDKKVFETVEGMFPEIGRYFAYSGNYWALLDQLRDERGADVVVDLHSTHTTGHRKFGYNPYIYQVPEGLLSLLDKHPFNAYFLNDDEMMNEKRVCIEIPADFIRGGFFT